MPLVRLAAQKRWNLKLIIVIGGLRCACHWHLGNLWALWLARLDARFMPRPGIGLRLWNIALAAQANAGQPLEQSTLLLGGMLGDILDAILLRRDLALRDGREILSGRHPRRRRRDASLMDDLLGSFQLVLLVLVMLHGLGSRSRRRALDLRRCGDRCHWRRLLHRDGLLAGVAENRAGRSFLLFGWLIIG